MLYYIDFTIDDSVEGFYMFKRNKLFFASSISLIISMICCLKVISLDSRDCIGISLINKSNGSNSLQFYIITITLCLLFSVLCFVKGKVYNPLSNRNSKKISKYYL